MKPFSCTPCALTALVFLSSLTAHSASAQDLNGQLVQVTNRVPDKTTITEDFGTQTVTATGAVFPAATPFYLITTIVTPTQITFANLTGGEQYFFDPFVFNGFVVSETGTSPTFLSNVVLDSATSVVGFTAANVTFDSTNVFADFQNTQFAPGQRVVLDVNPAAVPEASTTVSFGLLLTLGLGGIAIAKKKKAHT